MKHPSFGLGQRAVAPRRSPISSVLVVFSGWLAAAALLSPLAQAEPAPAPAAPVAQQFTLRNGMTLIVKPDHRAPTAVQMLWVRVGSMEEVDGRSGVAHVLEHMMFKGTPTVKVGEFSRRVAALGGQENAFTTKDYTGFYQQIPATRLEEVMRLESDRFAHNQWSNEEFAKELEVVKEERRMRTDDSPHGRLHEAMNAMIYQAAPYRRPVVGWMSDLEAMTAQDARDFYHQWYTPANAVVVVAGDVEPEQVRRLAETYYGSLPGHALPVRKPRIEPPQEGVRRMDFKAPAEQAYVALAFKVPGLSAAGLAQPDADSNDALALTVLSAVLSGFDGARLPRALTLTADSVADDVGAGYSLSGRSGPKLFTLYGVPAAGKTSAMVEAALRAQVALVAKSGVTEAELARVKNQWVAGEVYQQDSVFSQARNLGANWIQGFPLDTEQRLLERLRGVTAAQVQAVAAKYFGDEALTVATLLPQPVGAPRAARPSLPGVRHDD